jgi:hypothetical protein
MTRQTKHTPGPWTLVSYSAYEAHFEKYQLIAEIEGDGYLVANRSDEAITREQIKADVQLLAAAPDLLHACRAMLTILKKEARQPGLMAARETMTRAVAKATGETPTMEAAA